MKNNLILCAFIIFISGIIAGSYFKANFLLIAFIWSAIFLFLLFNKKSPRLFYILCAALIFCQGALSYINANTLPGNHINHILGKEKASCYIKGIIVSSPDYYWARWGKRKAAFFIRAVSINNGKKWLKTSGTALVKIKDSRNEYFYGDIVLVKVNKKLAIKSDTNIKVLGKYKPFFITNFIFNIRYKIENLIRRNLTSQNGAILNAMLIGRRANILPAINEAFINTGTVHILSISGLHVAVISAILFFALGLAGVPRKSSSVIIILFLIFYVILAGGRPPVVRSAIMIITCLFAYILERDFNIYSALSFAGILILFKNANELFNAGFILSFACVFSLCYITPIFEARLKTRDIKPLFLRYLARIFLASLAVFIGTMPIVAYYFKIISPITVFANILIIPFSSLILFAGMLFVALANLVPALASMLGSGLNYLFFVFVKSVNILSAVPFGYFHIPAISLGIVGLYYTFLIILKKVLNFT